MCRGHLKGCHLRSSTPSTCKPWEKTSQDENTPKMFLKHPQSTPKEETIGQGKDLLHGTFTSSVLGCSWTQVQSVF